MATAREIKTKIDSVKSTSKITRAMEMVAASKMRKAQDMMYRSRPYAEKILNIIGHLAQANPEYHHLFLEKRPVKRVGFIVITTDRGLCGGLNANLLRATLKQMKKLEQQGIAVDLCVIGSKGVNFYKRFGGNLVGQATNLGEQPSVNDLVGIVKVMLDKYKQKELDLIYLMSNEFVNTMQQKCQQQQLLPLIPKDEDKLNYHWDYIYEPDAKELLETLMSRYIESQVYRSVVENFACEQASRMVAMKSATDNAGQLIDDLQIIYNKARQAAITQEIAEIVGGASAID
jgi:F-type H+-transporting ATPase subunit gamma